jgi:heterodisulfide reductase subunit A-like polyferredoxin
MKSKIVGAGLIAGATWVAYNRLRKPAPLNSTYADAPTQILIVGGGFGGLAAARELARALSGS